MDSQKTFSVVTAGHEVTLKAPQILHSVLKDDEIYPNNGKLPLLVYPGAILLSGRDPAALFENLFSRNLWGSSWRNGIFNFHHYHSTAHEVLGVFSGSARVQLGGAAGIVRAINAGDVVIIPAGVSHKNLTNTPDFGVVGAYPRGQRPDLCSGKDGERPGADHNIARVPKPKMDPIYGDDGPLKDLWRQEA